MRTPSDVRAFGLATFRRYGLAVAAVAIATVLRLGLASKLGGGVPFILYYPAIVVSAWAGGFGPGLLSVALSALVAWYMLMAPTYSFALADPTAPMELVLFVVGGAMISLLAEQLHHARRHAVAREASAREERERSLRDAYQDARKRQREAESLAAVARTINTLEFDAALQNIAASACGLLDADIAAVFRLDGDTAHLIARGGPHGFALHPNVTLARGDGLVWLAVERREAVVSTDILTDDRFTYSPTMRARIETARHRAGLAVPLSVQGRIIGVLFVGGLPGREFQPDEVRLVTTFADQAAVVMANAELYNDAQRASRAKDEFLAMLGHELRNPLGAIAGASGVLKLGAHEAAAERARAVIDRQVQHLSRLVDDLLDVGRLTSGKVRLNRQPLDLGELVTSAMSEWRMAGRFARHQVTAQVVPVWIDADQARIEQVLGNLIGNALKFTPSGGSVSVRLAREHDAAVLQVADTGAGIPQNLGDKIFELFVQGERSLDRAQGGLGIGLTLVKTLVGLHGGTVAATSEGPGHGSVFTVRIPSIGPPTGLAATSAAPTPTVKRRRILIVEDNDDAREMLRVQLTIAGHDVHEAADGPAAVEAATALAPDIALIDIGLPGFDGYEVARRIRAAKAGKSVRLIALTGYGQAEDVLRAADAGFDGQITKPASAGQLTSAIDEGTTAQQ